ncbi:ATP-binding protein [Bacillus sp. T3]|uniref:sensor histidine kinase n=1 Tax=Bacillus sp. T3 TaxID=467262 RepID=UPI002982107D|nr:ATP-binding protein [Bacillus sp. T3]
MMTLVGIVLILLWFFQVVFLETFYNRMWISYIKTEVITINHLLEKGENEEFENKLAVFAFNNNIYTELVDQSGESSFITGSTVSAGKMPMIDEKEKEEVISEILAGKEVEAAVTHPKFGSEFRLIGLPIKISGEVSKAMLIITPLAPMEDTSLILKGQLIYITIILLFAAVLISYFLSRRISNPILDIKKAAEQIAAGNFFARIKISKKQDEIDELAETINNMGAQLSKIEQLRKDLIANVSHDLRTPLSLIRGYAETLRDVTGKDPAKREKQLGIIIEETERLSKIVDDIMNLSQLQSGSVELSKERFKINELIQTAVKSYTILSEKNGVAIVLVESEDVVIEADEIRISQVFYNLLNNAFTHTPSGGTITVNIIAGLNKVRIEISDTGSGISADELLHIWERYYKADKTSEKKTTGTGLGLAIVKEILEAHQVAYGVESKKNIGTTFWFELHKS